MIKTKYWIRAARPQTLIASAAPIIPVSILCLKNNSFNLNIFIVIFFSSLCIQIMTNFINDLYDYKKGADQSDRIGPDRMLQKGYLTEEQIKKGIFIVFIFALISGFYLVNIGGYPIFLIGLSSFLFAYLYTATRMSISYNGLGELFVFSYFGIIASIGTYYLLTLQFNKDALLIGSIAGCLNISLLVVNNLRDYKADIISNKNTLIVIFGKKFGRIEFLFMLIIPYILLYFLLHHLNKSYAFFWYIPLMIFTVKLIYSVFSSDKFIQSKAFPCLSLYITLFIMLLSSIIYL